MYLLLYLCNNAFCREKVWSQALVWSIILTAIALSSWGVSFFRRHCCSAICVLVSTYPSSFFALPVLIWQFVIPPETLERFTAWGSSVLLTLMGYSVVVDGIHVLLPTGGVSVYYGCTGFDMMITILSVSILTGAAFQMRWERTLVLSLIGTTFAFVLNLGRVALMAIAVSDWGEQAFEFWHGFWGGQIFAGLLFTIYYYLVVWMLPKPSRPYPKILSKSSSVQ